MRKRQLTRKKVFDYVIVNFPVTVQPKFSSCKELSFGDLKLKILPKEAYFNNNSPGFLRPARRLRHRRKISQPTQCPLAKPILPGNDDSEQMSAWYILSAIGFYLVHPESNICSLIFHFSKVVIHQTNGKDSRFVGHPYRHRTSIIQSVRLNGKELHNHEIAHADIVRGGELTLKIGSTPNVGAIR